ncbi:MAG: NYN domain-containing protein [bacterium]|nr:NYN domain-containing protein [bacterium]
MFRQTSKINWQKLGRVFIFIDAANLESAVKDLGWWIDYLKLKSLFSSAELVEIRDYCVAHNTLNQNNFFTFLKKNGFILITKPLKIIKEEDIQKGDIRKANFDVEIAVDSILLQNDFDVLVLFSGDSDFHYLIKKLQEKNKKVIVISTKHHVSKELIETSDRFIDLKKIRKVIERKGEITKSPSFATGG